MPLDETDYSFVVKRRAPPPNSWKWEIYRAGRTSPIEQSSVYFETMATASRAGKEALKQLLDKLRSERLPPPLMWSPDLVPKTAANDSRRGRER
jgi:hypothetical protein